MRVSLKSDPAEFKKQIADLRRFLTAQGQKTGQPAVSARLNEPAFLPFLTALRTELKADDMVPDLVFIAAADLIANLALTAVQSLVDAPPSTQSEMVKDMLRKAASTADITIAQQHMNKSYLTPKGPVDEANGHEHGGGE